MLKWDEIAIVGVGLIGASIGLAIKKFHPQVRVIGVGRREESLSKAKEVGAVDEFTTDLSEGVRSARLIIVGTPVGLIPEYVKKISEVCPEGALITDAGSTKLSIEEALQDELPNGVKFIGGHPMAGREVNGPENGLADLFVNKCFILTPTENSSQQDIDDLTEFWKSLGSRVIVTTAKDHDIAVANSSHLPHIVARALAGTLSEQWHPFAGTGFKDTTRIASGDPELWRQIFFANKENVIVAMNAFREEFDAFQSAIEENDSDSILSLLERAKQNRDALGS